MGFQHVRVMVTVTVWEDSCLDSGSQGVQGLCLLPRKPERVTETIWQRYSFFFHIINRVWWACELAQWVKVLSGKACDPRGGRREQTLASCLLTSRCGLWHMRASPSSMETHNK